MNTTYKPGDRQPGRAFLQTQEAGTGRWVTIVEYSPGTEGQLARARKLAARMRDGGLPALVIPPAVPLPTEPGLYRIDNDRVILFDGFNWYSPNRSDLMVEAAQSSRTFTRLAPVVETAAEVIDTIQRYWMLTPSDEFSGVFDRMRERFGVVGGTQKKED